MNSFVRVLDRWLALRNRVLSSPGFQRWAASFPLTRLIAQRRARALFDIVAGFVYSQVLFACVRLDLFAILSEGPRRLDELSDRLALSPDAARRLLRAAASLRLVQSLDGERYALGTLGAAMVGNPGIAAMVEHHHMVYADLADPVALLRGEARSRSLKDYWAYVDAEAPASADADRVGGYTNLMSESQQFIADDVLDAYSLKNHRCLLDVAGGDGTFLVSAAKRWPHLRVILFDLPAVAERARARFEREGLADRATAVGGDVLRDPLPEGADIVSLVRVLHDHDDAAAQSFIAAASKALPSGGTLMVAEPMAETPGAEPIGDAYFGFYLLAMGSGRARSPRELDAMLRAADLGQVRQLAPRRPFLTQLMLAQRGSGAEC
ncbi:O-methyltransferase family 2 [Thiorhodococcus drewsii AZ1]|uniref:O-methyltransferase family 2 n=1 Tax=Thiorhodococcus drewsii AZ1 TaxID=765913 RepID=G2DXP1_9GAMM|nr:O-methyltransferase family 2 [Thiorhodococcus drewsii AZ1]